MDPCLGTRPIVASDTWIDGSLRGYAIEAIREGLGLNLEYNGNDCVDGEGDDGLMKYIPYKPMSVNSHGKVDGIAPRSTKSLQTMSVS